MLNRLFVRNIGLLLAVNLLIKPLYILVIDAQVQNRLGESIYGSFFGVLNFCMLFQIVLDPGILNYNSQLVSKEPEKAAQHFSNIAGSKLLLALVYIGLVTVFFVVVGFPGRYYPILGGVLGILIFSSFSQYLRSHFAALGKYSYEAWFSGLDKMLMVLIIGYMLYVLDRISIELFIYGQLTALILSCVVFVILLGRQFSLSLRFSYRNIRALVKKSFPYALVLLLMTIYTRIDGVMLERMLPDNAYSAGLYARGFRLLDGANMIGIMFASLMLPMFSKLMHKKAELKSLTEDVSKLLFVISFAISLICWFYRKEIFDLIYTQNTAEHYRVFGILMIGFFAMAMSNIFGCLFLAAEELRAINRLFVVGIVINILLNYILIPHYGAEGAALTTLATQVFVFAGQFILAVRYFSIRYSRNTMAGVLIISFFSILIARLVRANLEWMWYIEILLISFLMALLAFLCGFLRFDLWSRR